MRHATEEDLDWPPEGDLEFQRAAIDRAFRYGWTPRAVRDGALPGDPLPPPRSRPFIDHVTDAEVVITGSGSDRRIAVLFSHEGFPGVRFGHRFRREPGRETYESVWLKEEIETGALHRMMRTPPPPDDAGVTWTTWGATAQSR